MLGRWIRMTMHRWAMPIALIWVLAFGQALFLVACGSRFSESSVLQQTPSTPANLAIEAPPKHQNERQTEHQTERKIDPVRLLETLQAFSSERHSGQQLAQTRAYLVRSLQSLGWQVEPQTFPTGTNLIATWPSGTATPQMGSPQILVGAHYDTVAGSPGADDNGTGVAALLEIARLYAQSADLMLVFFDQEEEGLAGSLAFVTPERVAELKGAIILEMLGATCAQPGCQRYPAGIEPLAVGQGSEREGSGGESSERESSGRSLRDRGDFIAVLGDAEHPELLQAFGAEASPSLPPVFKLSVPFKGVLTPDVLRSDHAPFWLQGVGAVLVTDTANLRNPHYHQESDRLETIDLDFFYGVVQRLVNAIEVLR